MTSSKASVAIVGAGMGGLTVAATLQKAGFHVNVYEQAPVFTRLGAGIQMSPNAMKVMRSIGLEGAMRNIAFQPPSQHSREWDTGEIHLTLEMGDKLETTYGAPYLLMHRGDLHAELVKVVPDEIVHRGKKFVGLETRGERTRLNFEDGTFAEADIVVGADGVHSPIRKQLFGDDQLTFTGRTAYRTTFKADLLEGYEIDDCTKWWGPDRHIVIYYITRTRDEVYFVTSVPDEEWTPESWSLKGDMDQLRAAFDGFHPQVRHVLEKCPASHKWPINTREPLEKWSDGNVVLLGDACHPMTPYMAQGAATSMEDAAVLTRLLQEGGDLRSALTRYESHRKPRTTQVQAGSHRNDWLHKRADIGWVYGYDAWTAPLDAPASA